MRCCTGGLDGWCFGVEVVIKLPSSTKVDATAYDAPREGELNELAAGIYSTSGMYLGTCIPIERAGLTGCTLMGKRYFGTRCSAWRRQLLSFRFNVAVGSKFPDIASRPDSHPTTTSLAAHHEATCVLEPRGRLPSLVDRRSRDHATGPGPLLLYRRPIAASMRNAAQCPAFLGHGHAAGHMAGAFH